MVIGKYDWMGGKVGEGVNVWTEKEWVWYIDHNILSAIGILIEICDRGTNLGHSTRKADWQIWIKDNGESAKLRYFLYWMFLPPLTMWMCRPPSTLYRPWTCRQPSTLWTMNEFDYEWIIFSLKDSELNLESIEWRALKWPRSNLIGLI